MSHYRPCVTADSACNAAGLGFSGYSKLGYAQWDLVTGVEIITIEASSLTIVTQSSYPSYIVWYQHEDNGEWLEHHYK